MKSDAKPFRILGVDHIGLAPSLPKETTAFLTQALGLGFLGEEEVLDQKVFVSFCASVSQEAEASLHTRLEVLAPSQADSPISAFLAKKGGGIHHIALKVDDIHKALSYLTEKGFKLIDSSPRVGAHGSLIAFIHPKSTGGILIELVSH